MRDRVLSTPLIYFGEKTLKKRNPTETKQIMLKKLGLQIIRNDFVLIYKN